MNLDDTARMAATIAASVAAAAALTFSGGALAHDECKTPGCTPSHSALRGDEFDAADVANGV